MELLCASNLSRTFSPYSSTLHRARMASAAI